MKYKLRKQYPTDPDLALKAILEDRGVTDLPRFTNPTYESCELNPFNLENIEDAAAMLIQHLKRNSRVLFVVD